LLRMVLMETAEEEAETEAEGALAVNMAMAAQDLRVLDNSDYDSSDIKQRADDDSYDVT